MKLLSALPQTLPRLLLAGTALALVGTHPLLAQKQSAGEWFDPTDWFDGTKVKSLRADNYGVYEYDYAYGLGDNFDYAVWSTYTLWDPKGYNAAYWDKQDWARDVASLPQPSGKPANYVIYPEPQGKVRESAADRDQPAGKAADRARKQPQVAEKEDQPQAGRQQVARLYGTVEGLRNVQLVRESGATNTYTIAKVLLDKGEHTVVNLGREALVKDLKLDKGAVIEAIGRRGKIEGHDVFVAHRLKAGNVTIDANPTIRLASQTEETVKSGKSTEAGKQAPASTSQETVTGTVTDVEKASATAGKPAHTLVELKLKNGKSTTIDLGPAASPEKIGLEQGENVTVRGHVKEQEDRKVLIPDLLKIGGERVASDSE